MVVFSLLVGLIVFSHRFLILVAQAFQIADSKAPPHNNHCTPMELMAHISIPYSQAFHNDPLALIMVFHTGPLESGLFYPGCNFL